MFQLRPYQQALLKQTQDALAADLKGRVMLQLPTGGGKTVIAGAFLADWLQDGRKAVWLTHRKELAEQTRGMLTDAGVSAIANVNWTPGEDAPAMAGGAVILMAQTVGRRNARREVWNRYGPNDLLVIDEAHHAAAPGWERAMRQWPGPIVGMTATPWRLSEKEGFDHLFGDLLCGPQTADLQSFGSLCDAQVFIPPPEERIAGGAVDRTGDYTESGIEQANRDRPDIMTAGALAFWQKHADNRQTIAYAVSVDHAHNLAAVFNEAGIPAAVILGDTNREERDQAIAGFQDGSIRVLVNVIVATEGFDLPDASCIIIARPTMSLALYLQMVGRGLRPKGGGDCLILDLAANSVTHGLPEDYREWSLEPRGAQKSGEAPVRLCPMPLCEAASPAASHNCRVCGFSFGKDCERCGRWRARRRWQYEQHCGDKHQLVCDLCHIDAHIQAHLPVTPPLDELVRLYDPEDEMTFRSDVEIDDDLANRLLALFKELLESERQSIAGADDARREELHRLIEEREAVLNDEDDLVQQFDEYIATLSPRPNRIRELQMYGDWEGTLKAELASWRDELNALENRPVDNQSIFNSARNKALHLLQRAAQTTEPISEGHTDAPEPSDDAADTKQQTDGDTDELSIFDLCGMKSMTGLRPKSISFPDGTEESINDWRRLYVTVADWLIDNGRLSQQNIPNKVQSHFSDEQVQFDSGAFKSRKLKNGMWLNTNFSASQTMARISQLLEAYGENPAQFHVQLR
ncbi:MAG: DEAD/DEAH box helicase [Chloroflexi bacterium]|nr:DEAD/DEAH box helicase [Chloroflexota bacterium]